MSTSPFDHATAASRRGGAGRTGPVLAAGVLLLAAGLTMLLVNRQPTTVRQAVPLAATTASAAMPVQRGAAASPTLPPPSPSPTAPIARPTAPPTAVRATAPTARAPVVRQETILFSAYQADPRDALIIAVRPDGTGRQVLGGFPGHPWAPKLSPDGRQVLFTSAAPGSSDRVPDGDLNGTGCPDLWVADVDGGHARALLVSPGRYNGWSWSPDGRWIAYAANPGGVWSIYKMPASGGSPVRLTGIPAQDLSLARRADGSGIAVAPAQDAWPAWTADGSGIIFASTRSDQAQLYRMDANGGNVRRLLVSPTADTEPAVAPGSGRIAFSRQEADGTGELYVLDRMGAAPRRLTNLGGLNSAPVWSPDGARVAFANRRAGRSDLYVVNAGGSGLTRLTFAGENQRPDWGTTVIGSAPAAPEVARAESVQTARAGGTGFLALPGVLSWQPGGGAKGDYPSASPAPSRRARWRAASGSGAG